MASESSSSMTEPMEPMEPMETMETITSAADLLRAYAAGRRDFRAANLRDADLIWANLRDADLIWAMAIEAGDTPETSQIVALTAGWVAAWLTTQGELESGGDGA